MKTTTTLVAGLALASISSGQVLQDSVQTLPVVQEETSSSGLAEALAAGSHWVKMRLRYESVDQDSFSDQADALTLRTLLGYKSGDWDGFSMLLEAEDVSPIGDDDFNSTVNGKGSFPVVADPDGTEVNQAFLQYGGFEDTQVRAGRQRIVLGDARFVGNVGWRQNEQTFDAYSVNSSRIDGLDVFYAHVTNVNRINGESHAAGNQAMASNLLQISHDLDGFGRLEAFLFDLDYTDTVGASTSTVGATLAGNHETESFELLYRAAFAQQSDAHDNPTDIDAGYMNLELGVQLDAVTIKVGQELLEGSGNPGDSFQTPLATGHKFNGWADKFLGTPDAGLEDTYVSLSGTWKGTNLLAVMHQFQSDEGSMDYGDELNLLASRKLDCGPTAGIKYADYS